MNRTEIEQETVAMVVAWRVKDYADGWIFYTDEARARAQASKTGALIESLWRFVPPPKATRHDAHELADALDQAFEYGIQPLAVPVHLEITHDGLCLVAHEKRERTLAKRRFVIAWNNLLADKRGIWPAIKSCMDDIRKEFA